MLVGFCVLLLGVYSFCKVGLYGLRPQIVAVIDDTPPSVSTTRPADGATYQYLALINCFCSDPESGIAYVHYTDDSPELNGVWCSLNDKGHILEGAWESSEFEIPPDFPDYDSFPGVYTPGTYNFQFEISNNNSEASLSTSVIGQYSIYTPFNGDWFVNNILVTDPQQELHFNTRTLTFKFVKTQGATVVTTTVSWTGGETGSMFLTETLPDTWEGSYTFSHGGRYVIELKASDGTTNIIMSIMFVDLPGGGTVWFNESQILLIAGGGLIVAGYVVRRKELKS